MKIRLMKIEDYESVMVVWQAAGLKLDMVNDSRDSVAMILDLNPTSCFVACKGKQVVGTVLGAFNGKRLWVYHLGVSPMFQGRGIGRALLTRVEGVAAKMGVPKVCLGVDVKNIRALQFYVRKGYQVEREALWLYKSL